MHDETSKEPMAGGRQGGWMEKRVEVGRGWLEGAELEPRPGRQRLCPAQKGVGVGVQACAEAQRRGRAVVQGCWWEARGLGRRRSCILGPFHAVWLLNHTPCPLFLEMRLPRMTSSKVVLSVWLSSARGTFRIEREQGLCELLGEKPNQKPNSLRDLMSRRACRRPRRMQVHTGGASVHFTSVRIAPSVLHPKRLSSPRLPAPANPPPLGT